MLSGAKLIETRCRVSISIPHEQLVTLETELSIDIDSELRPKCIKRLKSTTINRT